MKGTRRIRESPRRNGVLSFGPPTKRWVMGRGQDRKMWLHELNALTHSSFSHKSSFISLANSVSLCLLNIAPADRGFGPPLLSRLDWLPPCLRRVVYLRNVLWHNMLPFLFSNTAPAKEPLRIKSICMCVSIWVYGMDRRCKNTHVRSMNSRVRAIQFPQDEVTIPIDSTSFHHSI